LPRQPGNAVIVALPLTGVVAEYFSTSDFTASRVTS
jgi:hypothetical protein